LVADTSTGSRPLYFASELVAGAVTIVKGMSL